MSLDYLKINNSSGNSTYTPPEEFYRNYIENPKFFNSFERVMITMNNMINEIFPDVSVSFYGRIKSENSYFQKSSQNDRIFDIYAFKTIVNKVDMNHKFDKDLIDKLKVDFINSNKSINTNDFYNTVVAKEISNAFVNYALPYLEDINAINLVNRSKNFSKDNGFISFHSTLKTYPDSNICIPCNIELQCRSVQVDRNAPYNHSCYKKGKYGSDVSSFPYKEFNDCNTLKDFDNLCKKFVPCYVYLKDNKLIKAPNFINFIHYYSIFLFQKDYSLKGTPFIHQKELDKLNHFIYLANQNSVDSCTKQKSSRCI